MLSEAATFFPGLLSRILTPFSSHWASSPAFLLLFSRKIKPTLKSPRPLPHFEGQTPKIGVRSAKWGRGAFDKRHIVLTMHIQFDIIDYNECQIFTS